MKPAIVMAILAAIVNFGCTKPGAAVTATLEEKWRMVMVKTANTAITKPTDIQGEVDILFIPSNNTSGIFTGHTPTNDSWKNNYHLGNNYALSIPNLSMTKVMETSWGIEFVDNIRSTQKYSFTATGRLAIETPTKILIFEKL